MQNNKLFVANISFKATEDDFKKFFSQYGLVNEAIIIKDRMTQRSKGFGFVTMATVEEAQNAMSALNGKDFLGRPLTIKVAEPRKEK